MKIKSWLKRKISNALGLSSIEEYLQKLDESNGEILKILRNENHAAQERILHQVNYTNHNLYLHLHEAQRLRNLYYRDIMSVLDHLAQFIPASFVELETDYPIAIESDDHKFPWGTANDNTRSPRFVHVCEEFFKKPLSYMDLGCAGGGLVLDFTLRGHKAVGLEGSDYSRRAQRAEWRLLPNSLFTCDITKPFYLRDKATGEMMKFNVITAWELMEHIAKDDLPQLFKNILLHLSDDGIVVGSIATTPDFNPETGAVYHWTVENYSWWRDQFDEFGMQFVDNHPFTFYDFCRGTENGPLDENFQHKPDVGFHFVACKRTR